MYLLPFAIIILDGFGQLILLLWQKIVLLQLNNAVAIVHVHTVEKCCNT